MTIKEQIIHDQIMVKSFVAGFIAGVVAGAMLMLTIIAVFFSNTDSVMP
jgi:hypothetical protein